MAVATEPGASVATASPMSPLASASATSVPAMADRSSLTPPSDSGSPRIGSPISRPAAEQLTGSRARLVGPGRRRPDHLGGELGHHVDEQLLVLCGGQVELAGRLRRRSADACPAALAGAGEGAAGPGHRAEPAAGDREHRLLGLLAQPQPVEEVGLGEPAQTGDEVSDRVARLRGRHPVPSARSKVLEQGHAPTVTPSYTAGYRCSGGSGHIRTEWLIQGRSSPR